jgi:TRAP-type uncharacterized transport system substrate-binding protein
MGCGEVMGIFAKLRFARFQAVMKDTVWVSRPVLLGILLFVVLVLVLAVFWFFHSAPPRTIVITSGPEGSIFRSSAERYRKILARNGVTLKVLPSEGSQQNLKRLLDPSFRVDIGFVQGGVAEGLDIDKVVSLGSISYEPLLVFNRGEAPVDLLSRLKGKRLAIGPAGSGTRSLALRLLAENGIESGGTTTLSDLEAEDAAKALMDGRVDAVFLMGDSASVQTIRKLLLAPRVHIIDFIQADAYTRRITYLNKFNLPRGSFDIGKDIPDHDVSLIGPTVELIARPTLHPALCDLLLEAAMEVHGKAGLLKRQGEFPARLEHEFRISEDATRFYKSGRSFLYRLLPFRWASLVNRILVVFVPTIVVLIPVLRVIPRLYNWRIRSRIYRWYNVLLMLEKDAIPPLRAGKREELLQRCNQIEAQVDKMKVPASFGDQFYVLRQHILFVRSRLTGSTNLH